MALPTRDGHDVLLFHVVLAITRCGDLDLLLALSLALSLALARLSGRRAVVAWWAVLVATAAITAALKIYFSTCPAAAGALRSPSGHTAMSTLVYAAAAMVLARGAPRWQRIGAIVGAIALIAGIGVSRVLLQAHSVTEVVLGFALGGLAMAGFAAVYRRQPQRGIAMLPVLAIAVSLALATRLFTHPWNFEAELQAIGAALQTQIGLCR